MKIEGLEHMVDYTYKIEFRMNELIVDVNFTRDIPGKTNMTVIPKKFYLKYNEESGRSYFILARTPFTREISVYKHDSKWLIDLAKISGKVLSWVVEVSGWTSLAFTMLLLFFDVDMTKSLLDFLRVVKPITRFKYINIYYGGIIEIFLTNLKNIFHLVKDQRTDDNERLFVDTRSSLRRFYLPVLSFTSIPDKYLLYVLLCLGKYIQVKLMQYAKTKKRMTSDDELIVDIIDKVKVPLFCFLIFDVVFYTSHTLVHQSLVVKQDRNSLFSIILAVTMLLIFCFEFIQLLISNYRYKLKKKEEQLEELIVYTINQARLKFPDMPLSNLLKKFKKRSLNQINQLFYAFEEKISVQSAESRFFESTIKKNCLDRHFCAKYFNMISIFKVVMMEPIYITLQMNKLMQIFSLLLIQLAFTSFVIYSSFKQKIFYNWYSWAFTLINEISLSCYFITGAFYYFRGDTRSQSAGAFERLQTMLVLFLIVSIISAVCGLIVSQVVYIRKKCSDKKNSHTVKEEEENMKLINDITEKMSDETYLRSLLNKKHMSNANDRNSPLSDNKNINNDDSTLNGLINKNESDNKLKGGFENDKITIGQKNLKIPINNQTDTMSNSIGSNEQLANQGSVSQPPLPADYESKKKRLALYKQSMNKEKDTDKIPITKENQSLSSSVKQDKSLTRLNEQQNRDVKNRLKAINEDLEFEIAEKDSHSSMKTSMNKMK